MLPHQPHDPELKCGGPQMCPDCKAYADAWRERHQEAMKTAEDGKHAWFRYKFDQFDSCAKCGNIRRKDDKNGPCRGIVKIGLR